MQKNYFMKNVLAASMLLALSMGMSSCTGLVDAVLGTSDNPTTQPTTQPTTSSAVVTADQTTITVSSLEDMANAVSSEQNEEFIKAIEAKAKAGEEYTINIKSEQPLSTESFEGFVIPRVEGSSINLVFDQPLVTSETSPLKITADEKKSNTSTTAVNELTITMPDGASDVYLDIEMPETTVTLEGNVTYHYVVANTAVNTLYVESGVTIEELLVTDGFVVVKNGGKVVTYVYSPSTTEMSVGTFSKGVRSDYVLNGNSAKPRVQNEDGTVYGFENLKVIKGTAEYAKVEALENRDVLKKLIIGEGAAVAFTSGNPNVESIIGEGSDRSAKMYYGYFYKNDKGENTFSSSIGWSLMKIRNVTITCMPGHEDSRARIDFTSLDAENCTFLAKAFRFFFPPYTIKDCTFGPIDGVKKCEFGLRGSESLFEYTFENCEFVDGTYLDIVYSPNAKHADVFMLTFNKCKYAGKAITKDTEFLKGYYSSSPDDGITYYFIIDGVKYTPVKSEIDGPDTLIEVK